MTNIRFKIDDNDLKEFNKLCKNQGFKTSYILSEFIKQSIKENRLLLNLENDSFYTDSNISYLENKYNEFKDGNLKLIEHSITDLK